MSELRGGRQTTSPCAACKLLRRRCTESCVLAPYFPQNDAQKFADAHRVFGASNIIKMLEDLPLEKRADAVSSMVYEASARLRDPVYGCAGTIWQLQQHVSKLQLEKAILQAELLHMHLQHANFSSFIRENLHIVEGGDQSISEPFSHSLSTFHERSTSSCDELPNGYHVSDVRDQADQSLPDLWEPSWH
uniref:LBD1 n=1 Tax=Pinus tabuliformis TaxID=88731 RepID=A0A0K0M713_PINTB|nr:LBD1 [Pinus tabuliformis]